MSDTFNFTNSSSVNYTKRELRGSITCHDFWLGFLCVVTVVILTAPFGTGDLLKPLELAIYWLTITAVGYVICLCVATFVLHMLQKVGVPQIVSILCGGLVAGPIVATVIALVNVLLLPWLGYGTLGSWTHFYFAISVITVSGTIIHEVATKDLWSKTPIAPRKSSRFMSRLAPKVRSRVLTLRAQGHYVEVTTERGSELVLIRLKDAIAELDDPDGLQVHRSWWVSRDGVASVERVKKRPQITLKDGRVVPVSQLNLSQLREWCAYEPLR